MKYAAITTVGSIILPLNSYSDTNVFDLSGLWQFQLDKKDVGIKEKWFTSSLADTITLPNTTDTAGKGHQNGPELAQLGRLTRAYNYTGPAWYQREIEIPKSWIGRTVKLFLERVHWESRLWINGQEIGMQDSLSVPHEYNLTGKILSGRYRISLRIDNSIKYSVGPWAHSITDETMGNWNGVLGRIELSGIDTICMNNVRVGSDLAKNSLWLDGEIINNSLAQPSCNITCFVKENHGETILLQASVELIKLEALNVFRLKLSFNNKLELWDEFTPNLYRAEVLLLAQNGSKIYRDQTTITFGVREFIGRDGQFHINGRPTFLRGNLTCGEFPLTGHFPMDEAGWERILLVMKSYGLNHVRFHSHCPPEAGFAVADRLGFYLCPEAPFWAKLKGNSPEGRFLEEEAFRMIRKYGNHPSFVMMGLGNELGGDNPFFSSILCKLKQSDKRRIYTCDVNELVTGKRKSPIADCDFFVTRHTEKGVLRLSASTRFEKPLSIDGTDCDYIETASAISVPLIAHELGQWLVHPSGKEIPKYTGVMKAYNLLFFQHLIKLNSLSDQVDMLLQASGRLAWSLYKEDMELCFRTPGFGGFQLLQLQDFPGQGDALVGLLDTHWETKGIITPEKFRGSCCETVPLARFAKFVWTSDQTFEASLDVAHYGLQELRQAHILWTLTRMDGEFQIKGKLKPIDIMQGTVTHVGNIRQDLSLLKVASQMKLTVCIENTAYINEWPIWVYPPEVEVSPSSNILVAEDYNEDVKEQLSAGGLVLLSITFKAETDSLQRIIKTQFKPVTWSFLWRDTRHESTLGLLCDPKHPALRNFPTEFCSNWQWVELANNARAFVLNNTPYDYHPIVQGIDDFHRSWKLGHVIEGRVGNGRIILCGFDLHTDLQHRVVARQFRRSLLDYMAGPEFDPKLSLSLDEFFKLPYASVGQVIFTSSQLNTEVNNTKENNKTDLIKNSDKSTQEIIQEEIDQSNKKSESKNLAYGGAAAFDLNWKNDWIFEGKFPQELHLDFGQKVSLNGLLYKPSINYQKRVRELDVYVSNDKENWGKPAGHYTLLDNSKWFKNILFPQPQVGRYLRIVVTAGFVDSSECYIAEFEPIIANYQL